MRLLWFLIPLMLVGAALLDPANIILFVAGRDTTGRVAEAYLPKPPGFRPADVVYVFDFEDAQGRRHRGIDEVPHARANFPDELVPVRYLPVRPTLARVAINVTPTALLALLFGVGTGLFFSWITIGEYRFDAQLRRDEADDLERPLGTYQGFANRGRVTYVLLESTLSIREFATAVPIPLKEIESNTSPRQVRPALFWPALGIGSFCTLPVLVMLWAEGLSGLRYGVPFILVAVVGLWLAARNWRLRNYLVYPIRGGGEVWITTGYEGFDSFVRQLENQIALSRSAAGNPDDLQSP
jgi:hypothetical protein